MILGSHNTMSYRLPKNKWLIPIMWMGKCQSKDYKTQHEKYGVNCFDLRLFWDKKGNIEFRHGLFAYNANDFEEILDYCEKNRIICRILFEERLFPKSLAKQSKEMNLTQKFIDTCSWIEEKYPDLKCYCGRNCGTWKQLYKFKTNEMKESESYSSVTSLFKSKSKNTLAGKLDDLWPRFYALLNTKKKIKEISKLDNIIGLFDFINYQ